MIGRKLHMPIFLRGADLLLSGRVLAVTGSLVIGLLSSEVSIQGNPAMHEGSRSGTEQRQVAETAQSCDQEQDVLSATAHDLSNDDSTVARLELDLQDAPSLGSDDAPVTLVEFVDYECPFCGRAYATVERLVQKYGDRLRVVFKQNPLPFHADAPLAAEAVLAADEQGKFREMHNLLLRNQNALQRNDLIEYAAQVGLDITAFEEALDSGRFVARVQADGDEAEGLAATATPYFFVNGRPLRGAQPVTAFERLIEEELAGNLKPTRWVTSLRAPLHQVATPAAENSPKSSDLVSRGSENAPITLVEFTDYQSPLSARAQVPLYRVLAAYPDQVRLVAKHFSLSFHEQAQPAALAALAAHRQGRYWEYRLVLFANQKALSDEDLRRYALQVGLDPDRFESDRKDPKLLEVIQRDLREAADLGVRGTPTLFVNGKRMDGTLTFASLKEAIEQQLVLSTAQGDGAVPIGARTKTAVEEEGGAGALERESASRSSQSDRTGDGGSEPSSSTSSDDDETLQKLAELATELKALRREVGQLRQAVGDIHRVAARPTPTPPAAPTSVRLEDDDPRLGSPEARVAIVEFSEFQCPFCRRFHVQTFPKLKEAYIDTGKVQYIFRDFPLTSIHPHAKPAAIAANCAGKQGNYWEMHHGLFTNQPRLGAELYEELAKTLQLDAAAFLECLKEPGQEKEVDGDLDYGQSIGVRGTPHFFIGRLEKGQLVDVKRLSGAQPFQAFSQAIDPLLN